MLRFSLIAISFVVAMDMAAKTRVFHAGRFDVPYSESWREAGTFRNGASLIYLDATGKRFLARVVIWREGPQASHDAAVARIANLATRSSSAPERLTIDEWPAVAFDEDSEVEADEENIPPRMMRQRLWLVAVGRQVWRASLTTEPGRWDDLLPEAKRLVQAIKFVAQPAAVPSLDRNAPDVVRLDPRTALRLQPLIGPAGFDLTHGTISEVGESSGELELAASDDGRIVVIAAAEGITISTDGGATFSNFSGYPLDPADTRHFRERADPSVVFSRTGTFYVSYLGRFVDDQGHSLRETVTVASADARAARPAFTFRSHAVLCTNDDRFRTDQPHIAVDGGADPSRDQLYVVWRKKPITEVRSNCAEGEKSKFESFLSCSDNGGRTWSGSVKLGNSGMYPRVATGRDGRVHVVLNEHRYDSPVDLYTFSSCRSGLEPEEVVELAHNLPNPKCPVPGLDRCNLGNLLTSPTVAVDPRTPRRVFVSWSEHTKQGNDAIVVRTSFDAGHEFTETHRFGTTGAPGRRVLPWSCAVPDGLFVSWYDRTAATTAFNDTTHVRVGYVALEGTSPVERAHVAGSVLVAKEHPDLQCNVWLTPPRSLADSESCSKQPQNAGRKPDCSPRDRCRCDFSDARDADTPCVTGDGRPKYGDYRGIACAGGRAFVAWSSSIDPRDGKDLGKDILKIFFTTVSANRTEPVDICRILGGACVPARFEGAGIEVACARDECLMPVEVPALCQRAIDCPGCERGLCLDPLTLSVAGLDAKWEVAVIDQEGKVLARDVRSPVTDDRTIIVPPSSDGTRYLLFQRRGTSPSQHVTIRALH